MYMYALNIKAHTEQCVYCTALYNMYIDLGKYWTFVYIRQTVKIPL